MSRQGLRLLKLPTAGKVSTARRGVCDSASMFLQFSYREYLGGFYLELRLPCSI
jgi:hypothetical protein